MSKQQTELTQVISDGGIAAKHPSVPDVAALIGPATGNQHNTVNAGIISVACWRLEDVRFEFDSSFVVPGVEVELKNLAQLVKDHPPASKSEGKPGFPLSVFGHADPVGNDDYNKQLSGRRATAIYALLTRDTNLWEKLFSQPFGNDKWGRKSLETMLDRVSPAPAGTNNQEQAIQHERNPGKRKDLFGRYMENLCGPELKLEKEDFLARGEDAGGKGDFQGCSEFNPILIFSQNEQNKFEQDKDKTVRNAENSPNRRVVVLIFRKGSRVTPSKWPCPRATEGVAGCKKRFFSDGERRRNSRLSTERREFGKTKDTFACRFYDRLSANSPCELVRKGNGLFFMQCLAGDGQTLLAKRKYTIRSKGSPSIQFKGVLDDTGTLRHERVPPGDYLLNVQDCAEETAIAVLRNDEQVPQVQLLENGRLAIHVLTPDGQAIPDALVAVDGVGNRQSDEDGLAYFNVVQEGEFSFNVSKANHGPSRPENVERLRVATALVGEPPETGDDSGDNIAGKVEVKDRRADVVVTLKAKSAPTVAKIVRIEGTQAATRTLQNRKPSLPLVDNKLPSSSSQEIDLSANKPAILVRGSRPFFLKAITEPPGQVVSWEIVANQSAGPVPELDPKQTIGLDEKDPESGTQTEVKTDKVGSFAAIAKVGSSSVIWNFVLVGVEVDPASTFTVRNEGLMDVNEFINTPEGKKAVGLGVGEKYDPTKMAGVASGFFQFGKHAWSSEVRVTLKGGGTGGTLGCDQVIVQILQNIDADNTRGLYTTKIAFTDSIFPLLDAPAGSPEGYDGPVVAVGVVRRGSQFVTVNQCPFIHSEGMFKLTKNDPTARVLAVGDSPAIGFNTEESGERLNRIDREMRFRVGLVSFSKDSKNAIVAHAELSWQVDYTGKVEVKNLIGKWSKDGAEVKVTNVPSTWKPILSSSGVQGTDAGNALFEIFPPRAIDETNKAKKVINKP